jgi:hypothetical protein
MSQHHMTDPRLLYVILSYIDPESVEINDFMNHPDFDPELVDYILSFWSKDIHDNAVLDASRRGDLDILQVLIDAYGADEAVLKLSLHKAIVNNHLPVVEYLVSVGAVPTYFDVTEAMRTGNMNIAGFLIRIVDSDFQ